MRLDVSPTLCCGGVLKNPYQRKRFDTPDFWQIQPRVFNTLRPLDRQPFDTPASHTPSWALSLRHPQHRSFMLNKGAGDARHVARNAETAAAQAGREQETLRGRILSSSPKWSSSATWTLSRRARSE